jgi:hypothetical protein
MHAPVRANTNPIAGVADRSRNPDTAEATISDDDWPTAPSSAVFNEVI